MSSELETILRRIKPDKRRGPLHRRTSADLPFLGRSKKLPRKVLYDTSVYIDRLQGTISHGTDRLLMTMETWHSTVTEAELTVLFGALDPAHPGTDHALQQLLAIIQNQPAHRTLAPDRAIWMEAGVVTGLIARLQNYGKEDRRKLLFDALIFGTARKHGLAVLTRNSRDFDFLQQIDPSGNVLFYDRV